MKKSIGVVLRRVREDAGISQRDLARATGMPVSQISMLETSGRANPGFLTIAKLAKGLRLSMDALAAECAWGEPEEAASSLAAIERRQLQLVREIERTKTDAERTAARLGALLDEKPVKRARKKTSS